jgi:hypothetical protein
MEYTIKARLWPFPATQEMAKGEVIAQLQLIYPQPDRIFQSHDPELSSCNSAWIITAAPLGPSLLRSEGQSGEKNAC